MLESSGHKVLTDIEINKLKDNGKEYQRADCQGEPTVDQYTAFEFMGNIKNCLSLLL